MSMMTQEEQRQVVHQNDVVFAAFLDLEMLVQEYRKAVLWLSHGNHEITPEPSVQDTRELMRELKGKITGLLDAIETRTR